ncbi:serine/threonine-protein kinase [Edaphobacter albus]|uniref:SPOR domain-containing protein n=1 Tax=Edaphobacter sp. 4G125 TaxID=2763071 RepID=UPI00164408F1|nr:SPOR domain-containing protein [Edaphobacter sp. 4G125]QNI37134.1 SPOR domain-containing protein [Edaphobacter sp. 4G125]
MQLWNDYEGRTIADAYPLKKLVRPEGRSAFFLTTNGTGTPAMVRLIEAHFDESEILSRWKKVSEIKQENLVAIRKYGETVLDGTPLVYAVMEPTEMSLADLLQNRTMTIDEAKQLANSLLTALTALHSRGLVHGHIEPVNILAAGETVKLRSDCVREAAEPDGSEADITRKKAEDTHAVAVVLLQALTGRRNLQGSATLLPSPFDGIIRNGLSGKWGLSEMAAALGPVAPVQVAAAVPAPRPTEVKEQPKEKSATVVEESKEAKPTKEAQANLFEKAETASTGKVGERIAPQTAKPATPVSRPTVTQAPDVRHRIVKPIEEGTKRTRLMIAAAAVILLLVFFGWRMTRSEPAVGASEDARTAVATPQPVSTTPAPEKTSAARPLPGREITSVVPASGRTQWRVVAYTYNHEAQAQQKVETLKKQQPSLNPEVFSPNGRAPYLVTLGGPMTREDAEVLKRKARSSGLPRDIYTQNYDR